MSSLQFCLLCALASAACPVLTAPVGHPEPARHEELTLLFHGALQLGQSLNSVYRSTETRLNEARYNLGLYDRVLGFLGQEVSEGQEDAQELRASLSEMQVEEDELKLQAEASAQALAEAAQGQKMLWESMKRLETQLQGAQLGHTRHQLEDLKAHADKQSHLLWILVGHVQRQRQQLALQQKRLEHIRQRLNKAMAHPA